MNEEPPPFKDKEWGTDRPAVVGVDKKMNEEEQKGLFGWIFAHRERIVVEFLKWVFGIGISLIYFSGLITIADGLLKWLIVTSPEFEFAWKTTFLALGISLVVIGLAVVVWVVLIAYYLRFFNSFKDRLEFIDPVRRLK